MPRRIRVFPLRRLRRFLTIHERGMWELMAAMAYASPVALFPYTEMRTARTVPPVPEDDHQADPHGELVPGLTEAERRVWRQLSQQLSGGQVTTRGEW
jgi:hypothetical protein